MSKPSTTAVRSLVGICLAVGLLAYVANATVSARPVQVAQDGESPTRSITMDGSAVVCVDPDEATLSFGVTSASAALAEAIANNDQRGQAVVAALKRAGVEDGNLATTRLEIRPLYQTRERQIEGNQVDELRVVGYEVSRTYQVRVVDLPPVTDVIAAGMAAGANSLSGPAFVKADTRADRDRARDLAAEAAREKAERLAATLGCRLGPPREVSEVARSHTQLTYSNVAAPAPQAAPDAGENALPAGRQELTVSVTVTFDLIPNG